ncbi:hypothetical protein [Corynebacterium pacaense]|nr:hypothetical protein [Corynebacterium pacaense]
MDFNAIINPIIEFFSTGVGQIIAQWARVIFDLIYPANADAPVIQG